MFYITDHFEMITDGAGMDVWSFMQVKYKHGPPSNSWSDIGHPPPIVGQILDTPRQLLIQMCIFNT